MTTAALLLLLVAGATALLGVVVALVLAARGAPGRPEDPPDWARGDLDGLPSRPYRAAHR